MTVGVGLQTRLAHDFNVLLAGKPGAAGRMEKLKALGNVKTAVAEANAAGQSQEELDWLALACLQVATQESIERIRVEALNILR